MAVAARSINPKRTLLDVARQCITDADNDRAEAAKRFRFEIDQDGDLRRELIEPLLERACWDQIRRVAHTDRLAYWSKSAPAANKDQTAGVREVARQHARDWLSYPLSCGKALGDASKEEIESERDMHDMHARKNAIRAKFYAKIVSAMGKAKRVRDALNNDQLDEFSAEVSHA